MMAARPAHVPAKADPAFGLGRLRAGALAALAALSLILVPVTAPAQGNSGKGGGGQSDSRGNSGGSSGRSGDSRGGSGGGGAGRSDDSPGRSGSASGRSGSAPGRADDAPSSFGASRGRSNSAPGRSGSAPGRADDGPSSFGTSRGQPQSTLSRGSGAPGGNRGTNARGNAGATTAPAARTAPSPSARTAPVVQGKPKPRGTEGKSTRLRSSARPPAQRPVRPALAPPAPAAVPAQRAPLAEAAVPAPRPSAPLAATMPPVELPPAVAPQRPRAPALAPVIAAPADPGRVDPSARNLFQAVPYDSFPLLDQAPPDAPGLPTSTLPVVVELFTSQGCSSCPPADAMLTMLKGQGDVLALSYHVDYWDYLGWEDSFARPEFTERQTGYANIAGERSIYTPQMIVDGQDTAVAPNPAQLMGLIDGRRYAPAMISIQREKTRDGEAIELQPLSDLDSPVDIAMVRYAPQRIVEVRGGENSGKSVAYSNVVLSHERLARWDGKGPLRLNVRTDQIASDRFPADTRHAVLVQQVRGARSRPGPILAAIKLD